MKIIALAYQIDGAEKTATVVTFVQRQSLHRRRAVIDRALVERLTGLERLRYDASLACFFNDLESGEIDLAQYKSPSRSKQHDWNLEFPPNLVKPARSSSREGEGE